MQRTIKFRGKRLDTGDWVYGSLVSMPFGSYICDLNDAPTYGQVEVDPATVGQYTGLKDKNGREIYEGDIELSLGTKSVIVFRDGAFMRKHPTAEAYGYINSKGQGYREVIGNIHDNPELLEGGKSHE